MTRLYVCTHCPAFKIVPQGPGFDRPACLKLGLSDNLHRVAIRPEGACPLSRWPDSKPLPAEKAERIAAREKARIKRRNLRQKARAFAEAVTGPKVSPEEFERRMAICKSNRCGHLIDEDGKFYCGACGCPRWRKSELHEKLWFARLECPLEEPLWSKA